jgi:molybdopterin synthase catalytic subunit
MEANGIDSQEFGGFVKDKDEDGNEIYMLRYEEFIAIHTKALQNINKRLEAAGL